MFASRASARRALSTWSGAGGTRWSGAHPARPVATTLFIAAATPVLFVGCGGAHDGRRASGRLEGLTTEHAVEPVGVRGEAAAAVWDRYRTLHGLSTTQGARLRQEPWPPLLRHLERRPMDARAILANWWHKLPEGSKMTLAMMGLNLTVFCGFRVPAFRAFLTRNFMHSASYPRLHTVLTAGFSHVGGVHFLANMYGLYLFMPLAASVFGAPQTLFVYLTGIMVGTYTSTMVRMLAGLSLYSSLGASGGVMTLLGMAAMSRPDVRYHILFLPSINFSAERLVAGTAILDIALMLSGRTKINHLAHLGGLGLGYLYVEAGLYGIWRDRGSWLAPMYPTVDRWLGPEPKPRKPPVR